jgi:hypothetical protein
MAELKWKYSKDEINMIRSDSESEELNEVIESWWITKENPENTPQEEIDEIESTITHMM